MSATRRRLGSAALLLCLAVPAGAQEVDKAKEKTPKKEQDLVKRSLPLRTALYHDPTLGSPLERLLEMYQKQNRAEELLGLYRTHLRHYPTDAGATTVLARLLLATNDPDAENFVRRAVGKHAKHSYLRFLLYRILSQENDPRALDHLDKAIGLEIRPTRKRTWIRQLLKQAVNHDKLDLAKKHLKGYGELLGGTPAALLAAARKMHELGLYAMALGEIAKAKKKSPSPEAGVELDLFAATVEVSQNKHEKAAKRLDALLGRLTADYWRRPEILRRRARLIRSPEAREALVKKARASWTANKADEAATLDLARLLAGFDRHREALEVVLESSKRLPSSIKLEKEALELFDRLREERGREKFLAERVASNPERLDLKDQQMRSLFMLGKRPEALKLLEGLTKSMSKADRVKRYLETARYLRGQAFPTFAADVFGKAVELAPERLDLRRELAETHLASGDRSAAHRVLNVAVPKGADTALLLDLVQLMIREELFSATRRAIGVQLEKRPDHFELLLALLEVEGRTGNGASGKTILGRTRKLADNKARYRRWLESAIEFHDMFDKTERFLTEEQKRISEESGPWNKKRLERLLTFTDLNAQHHRGKEVSKMLAGFLKLEGLPKKVRIELRRQMVGGLEADPGKLSEAETELKALSKADPQRDNEYRARLAALYLAKKRPDQAKPLLKGIRINTLSDAALLTRLEKAFTELNQADQVAACLERIARIDPANKANWERWVEALASRGEERRLRAAVRRILRGGPKLKVEAKTRRLLRTHLADSYWRSVGAHLSKETEVASLEALSLLDQIERTTEVGGAWVWIMFARAHAHNLLGRTKARDAALAELERAYETIAKKEAKAKELEKKKKAAKDKKTAQRRKKLKKRLARSRPFISGPSSVYLGRRSSYMPMPSRPLPAVRKKLDPNATALPGKHLRFPDGLSASRDAIRALLSKPFVRRPKGPDLADRHGPTPPLRIRWAFETYGRARITGVFRLDDARVLVSDTNGSVYGVDRKTGKLSWGLENVGRLAPPRPKVVTNYRYRSYNPYPQITWPVAVPVVAPDGRFFLGVRGGVSCYGPDGKLRWKVTLVKNGAPMQLRIHAGRLLGFEPQKGVAVGIDLETAKVAWLTRLPEVPVSTGQFDPNTAGVSAASGRFFVYGGWAAILDAKSGAVLWSFEPHRVRKLPVKLSSGEGWGLLNSTSSRSPYISHRHRGYYASNRRYSDKFLSYLARGKTTWSPRTVSYGAGPATTTIVAPAAQWATQRYPGQTRHAILAGHRLLLFQSGANPTGAYSTDLRLPLFGKLVSLHGTPVGVHGSLLAMVDGYTLSTYDLVTGEVRASLQLGSIARHPKSGVSGSALIRVNASIDPAGVATVTGPGGVMAVSLPRMRVLYRAPWPEIIQPELPKTGVSYTYGFRGVHSRNPGAYYGNFMPYDPLVGHSEKGVLYAPTDPYRLVALRRDGGD